jgi:branched-chain amino acid transport system substrate-binding protein
MTVKLSRLAAVVGTTCLVVLAAGACGSSKSTSSPTTAASGSAQPASGTPITLGYVGDLTGVSSSAYVDGPGGAMARIDLQNAEGGIDGHPLKLIVEDTQSSPTTEVTAVQDLVSKGVFGIISSSSFSYAGVKYEHSMGIPEIPVCPCGPNYVEQPYTNTFSYTGSASPTVFDGVVYTNTSDAQFLKDIGVTKLAGLGYGISVASIDSIKEVFAAGKHIGGPTACYQNYSVPFGAVDFTAAALQIKAAGCNGVVGSFVDASDISLTQAVKNGGINAKQLYFTGYDNNVLTSAGARSAFQNVYADTTGPNFTTPNPATKTMLSALQKYDRSYKGGIPDLGLWGSYITTDLMIHGLELSGPNPTRAVFIKDLRNDNSYNAEGALPTTVSFHNFGTPAMLPQNQCAYYMQLKGSNFVVYQNKPICGPPLAVPGI